MKKSTNNLDSVLKLLCLVPLVLLVSCDPGLPTGQTSFVVGGAAAPLSQAEYNALSPEQQYKVASKLYGTFFRGITADEFFDLSNGVANLKPRNANFINDIRNKLSTNLSLEEVNKHEKEIDGLDDNLSNPDPSKAKYIFDNRSNLESNQRPRELPLARIKEYPISRDLYVNWMAYFLANTVQYSPAEEMESTDMQDVQRMFRFLFNNINDRTSIRQMVRSNLASLARWRVARTPQNHALEAFENYLGLFQNGSLSDEEKLKNPVIASLPQSIENAGIACRDYFLTRASDDYLIAQTDFPNTSPKLILEDSFVVTCDDVYDVVAGHNLLIPRAVEVIINYFMPGQELSEPRLAVSQAIVNAKPATYEDIITAILFSREYLLNTKRPKSFEETLFPLLDSLKWDPSSDIGEIDNGVFEHMMRFENQDLYLRNMNWQTMSYKIGRLPSVPLDALSFAGYHKALREELLQRTGTFRGGVNNMGDGLFLMENSELLPFITGLSMSDYIDYLFLNTLHRKATADEQAGLYDFEVNERNNTSTNPVTGLEEISVFTPTNTKYEELTTDVLDYISRLPELYYYTPVN